MSAKPHVGLGEPIIMVAWRDDEAAGRKAVDDNPERAVRIMQKFITDGPHVTALRQARPVVAYIAEQAVGWQPPFLGEEGVGLAEVFDGKVREYHRAPDQGGKLPIPLIVSPTEEY